MKDPKSKKWVTWSTRYTTAMSVDCQRASTFTVVGASVFSCRYVVIVWLKQGLLIVGTAVTVAGLLCMFVHKSSVKYHR